MAMTEREMLELAAFAAGLEIDKPNQLMRDTLKDPATASLWIKNGSTGWNPLTDDGQALRLAAKLKIDIEWQATNPFPEPRVEAYQRNAEGSYFCADEHEDSYRRAIVRAAAEIGKAMQEGK